MGIEGVQFPDEDVIPGGLPEQAVNLSVVMYPEMIIRAIYFSAKLIDPRVDVVKDNGRQPNGRQFRGESLQDTPHEIRAVNVVGCQRNDTRFPRRVANDQPFLTQASQRFADGRMTYSKVPGQSVQNDSFARTQVSTYDQVTERFVHLGGKIGPAANDARAQHLNWLH